MRIVEEFNDYRWDFIFGDEKVKEILNNPDLHQVTKESFRDFLSYAWMVCASHEQPFMSFRELAIKIKEEMEIYKLIEQYKNKYGYIPSDLRKQGLKDFKIPEIETGKGLTEENILNAADRQKKSCYPDFLGDYSRLLTQYAINVFGGPRHAIVAIVLTAAIRDYGVEVTESQVKDFNRVRRNSG